MKPTGNPRAPKHRVLSTAVTLALAAGTLPALAAEYTNGDFSLQTSNSFSYGVQSRVEGIDEDLIGKANLFTPVPPSAALPTGIPFPAALPNAVQRTLPGRFSVNSDDGNRKWEEGDVFSNAIKWTGELDWRYGDTWGGFMRATAFYDYENQRRDDISDLAKEKVGKDVQLLDFFVYGNFLIGGEVDSTIRLGRQVVSWGESTFIQGGINVINPIDVSKLRVAGAELKEAFLPIDMLHASFSFNENLSIEALYMAEFEITEPEPSGTYFSGNDFAALGGEYVMLNFGLVPDPIDFGACPAILAGQNPLGLDPARSGPLRQRERTVRRGDALLLAGAQQHRIRAVLPQLSQSRTGAVGYQCHQLQCQLGALLRRVSGGHRTLRLQLQHHAGSLGYRAAG